MSRKHLCTSRAAGREIDRSQYADAVEENNKRYHENAQLYRKRQEISEHIFGTIKRQWGYNHTNLTGLEKVNGEHSLIMLVYNIKRSRRSRSYCQTQKMELTLQVKSLVFTKNGRCEAEIRLLFFLQLN
jgi:hypothetical protein